MDISIAIVAAAVTLSRIYENNLPNGQERSQPGLGGFGVNTKYENQKFLGAS